ncbi:MAG: hypothetical protein NC250_01605 [Alistipes senegalensis]|nr:hypothetical protein [Alistipes senegalensis]
MNRTLADVENRTNLFGRQISFVPDCWTMGVYQNLDESDRLDNIATQVFELPAITSNNLLGYLIELLSGSFREETEYRPP